MHVAIQHDDPLDATCGRHRQRANRTVVEHAVTFAVVGERTMRTAGEICRDAFVQRGAASLQWCASQAPRAFDHLHSARNACLKRLGAGQLTPDHTAQIVRVMVSRELLIGRGVRLVQSLAARQPYSHQHLAQK